MNTSPEPERVKISDMISSLELSETYKDEDQGCRTNEHEEKYSLHSDKSFAIEESNEEDFILEDQPEIIDGLILSNVMNEYTIYDYKSLFNTVSKRGKVSSKLVKYKPPLIKSQFDFVPPTINFVSEGEKINKMPENLSKLLKWKKTKVTVNTLKAAIKRSNFKWSTANENDWIGSYGTHKNASESFATIKEFQKINHFPGTFKIWRKDSLSKKLSEAQAIFGRNAYDFVPLTFELPRNYFGFKNETESNPNLKWIIKPRASTRGQGIKLVDKIDQIKDKESCIAQEYLSKPYLINGHKFDLRLYVYVTSFNPLRIYIFDDGLTRFASRKYTNSTDDVFVHLTNHAVNVNNEEYIINNDPNAAYGHKWSVKALLAYLKVKGINTDELWNKINDLVVKTIICGDKDINEKIESSNLKSKYSVHELFGFDVLIDENLKPWIIEVNVTPSLLKGNLDESVNGQMIADLFNLAGFMLPNTEIQETEDETNPQSKVPKELLFNEKILPQKLSDDEAKKHDFYIKHQTDEKILETIFDCLTPDDIRTLIETEDEYARKGNFQRIFPSSTNKSYRKFFETPRYHNILLSKWVDKYKENREEGIRLLNSYCKKKVHLQNPATSIENQWTQYERDVLLPKFMNKQSLDSN